jgi:hypothetical protein
MEDSLQFYRSKKLIEKYLTSNKTTVEIIEVYLP